MKIIETKHIWNGQLYKRNSTKHIILHHRAGNGDVESIHAQHLSQGWTGIGYHFYVRKDGTVYVGRPIDVIGAHATGFNNNSIGICFEGNFDSEVMSQVQLQAGRELVAYVRNKYPNADVKGHGDYMTTACPGKNFPIDEIINPVERKVLTEPNDIIWELSQRIEIHEVDRAVAALEKAKNEDSSLYWILYKLVNREDK